MNASPRKQWKSKLVGASLIVATAAVTYTGVSALNDTSTPISQDGGTAPIGRGGRGGGRGGHGGELQGLSTNPPAVELAPAQDTTSATQSTELVPGAEYYDGSYYGDIISAGRWGNMQVVAVIEEGELVDVLIASYPQSTYESDIITRNALPTLISEAIEAQDSDIDFVSRATDSSRAFVQSLDSALLDAAIGMDL